MQTIFVLGTWSSGSTALTGYLERLGAYTCPPHIHTRDERTPNSHESVEFRNLLAGFRDEFSLKEISSDSKFRSVFMDWHDKQKEKARMSGASVMALKHPLSAFFVPQLASLENSSFLVITRRFSEIERTRERRNWLPVYGALGAARIYSAMMSGLIEAQVSFQTVAFRDFLNEAEVRQKLRENLPKTLTEADVGEAESWLRT